MIRNEIGLYNRWGRFAFRWRTYRGMHHWIRDLKIELCWSGYHDSMKISKQSNEYLKLLKKGIQQ